MFLGDLMVIVFALQSEVLGFDLRPLQSLFFFFFLLRIKKTDSPKICLD